MNTQGSKLFRSIMIIIAMIVFTMLLYVLNLSGKKNPNVIKKISAHSILSDIDNTQKKNLDTSEYITRSYHSSDWEKLWLNNIHKWQNNGICEALFEQTEQICFLAPFSLSPHW